MNPYIKSLGSTDIMSGSEEKTPNESPEQGEIFTYHMVIPLKESSKKWATEWSQFKESNNKLRLWMTWIKDVLALKEAQEDEGSEKAVQMAELWTQVLNDLQPWYQLWDQHFETIRGEKMTIIWEGQCRYDLLSS